MKGPINLHPQTPGPTIPIGRIAVAGGTSPKTFSWGSKDLHLSIERKTGQLTLAANTPPGKWV